MKFAIEIVLLFHISIVCARPSLECLADYLKFRNVHDNSFNSVEPYTGPPSKCTDDLRAEINDIYRETRMKIESNFLQKPYVDCAIENVEGEIFENIKLKALAIDLKGVGLKFWKISAKNAKIDDINRKAQEMVDDAIIKCKGVFDYGAFFDSFFEQKRRETLSDINDYCVRKHLVEKALINPKLYNFQMNPKNINVNDIDCNLVLSQIYEQMKISIASVGSPCVVKMFIDNGYLDLMMKIEILAKLNITPAEKASEKEHFVNTMINVTHRIKKCTV